MPDVTILSPNTYFNFTPLLASTAVGTLEFRCAIEPVSDVVLNNSPYLIFTDRRFVDTLLKWQVRLFRYLWRYANAYNRHIIKLGVMKSVNFSFLLGP